MRMLEIAVAYIIDLLWGDPPWIPHPIVGMGKSISYLEKILYPAKEKPRILIFRGGILVLAVLLGVYFVSRGFLLLVVIIQPYLGIILSIWLLSTTLAAKSLDRAAKDIWIPLVVGDLHHARLALAKVVGRDTENLSQEEIVRGTVETVAENIVDGITAPLFYALVGGAPLALVYKAVNTMDSMLGYKNPRYLYFGRVAAKVDDLFNYIPARITFFIILLAGVLLKKNRGSSWHFFWQEAKKHPSPNSGFSEAATAGLLGVRLGGLNYYHGEPSFRAYMGKGKEPLRPQHIMETIKVMYITELLFIILCYASWYLVARFLSYLSY